jgi:hypothetical protein
MQIVYNLVAQKLNGQIKCNSSLGKGVEFIIEIPLEIIGNKFDLILTVNYSPRPNRDQPSLLYCIYIFQLIQHDIFFHLPTSHL